MGSELDIRIGLGSSQRGLRAADVDFDTQLAPLVSGIRSAAKIEAGIAVPVVPSKESRPPLFALNSVDSNSVGSVNYRFLLAPEVTEAVGHLTAGLAGKPSAIVPKAADAIKDTINKAIRSGLTVQLKNGVETPRFTKENPPPDLAKSEVRRFLTELYVQVIRVGGKPPKAEVFVHGLGKKVTVRVSGVASARELGNHLYNDAVLIGMATFVVDPERFYSPTKLLAFKEESHRLLRSTATEKLFEELSKASGGAWDHVDPSTFRRDETE